MALLYTKRFRENHPTQIGVLFDGIEGTLTYFKDGKCLGVAFRGLHRVSGGEKTDFLDFKYFRFLVTGDGTALPHCLFYCG